VAYHLQENTRRRMARINLQLGLTTGTPSDGKNKLATRSDHRGEMLGSPHLGCFPPLARCGRVQSVSRSNTVTIGLDR
jgi:hypothetical protein